MEISVICILKFFALSLQIKKELLIASGHLVAETRLDEILYDTSIYTLDLQIATVDANHINNASSV